MVPDTPDDPQSEPIAVELATLRSILAKFITERISADHLVADLALIGLMIEVEENAGAVRILLGSEVPDRAFPNGRAVFEAAQQALLLTTHQDYDYAGALAWVYHLRKQHALEDDFETVMGSPPSTPLRKLRLALDEIAACWEDFSPGKGALIPRADAELVSRKGKGKRASDNWLGSNVAAALDVQVQARARELGVPTPPALAQRNKVTYAYLCRGTHPYTRLRPDNLRGQRGGQVRVGMERPDRKGESETLSNYVASSLQIARLAMRFRIHRFK